MLSSLTQSPGRLQSLRNRFSLLPNTWKGVLLALISTATFTVVGVIVRILSDSMEVFQILLFRQLVFVALLTPAICSNIQVLLKPKRLKLHLSLIHI